MSEHLHLEYFWAGNAQMPQPIDPKYRALSAEWHRLGKQLFGHSWGFKF